MASTAFKAPFPEYGVFVQAGVVESLAARFQRKADPANRVDFRTPEERVAEIADLRAKVRTEVDELERRMREVEEIAATEARNEARRRREAQGS